MHCVIIEFYQLPGAEPAGAHEPQLGSWTASGALGVDGCVTRVLTIAKHWHQRTITRLYCYTHTAALVSCVFVDGRRALLAEKRGSRRAVAAALTLTSLLCLKHRYGPGA